MSNILRSSFKYSIKQFGINSLKFQNTILGGRSPACINHFLNNQFQTSAPLSSEKIDKYIKKLDQDARRVGRISLREVEDVFEEIKSNRSASSTQSLMVIRCCGNLISTEPPEKRTLLVEEIWNTFEKLGINLDISHYNALLRVYLENEHPFVPTNFLSDLEKRGIEPNRVTFQRLITRYCQTGDIEGATRILEFMREKEMPVNEIVFNALVLGHSQANDMESAEGILNVMKQAGIDPSAETYTILICGYIKQGNLEKVKELLEHCEKFDVCLIDKDYLEIVYNLALHNHNVDEILSKIRKNIGYNQEAMNYIYRLVSANKIEPAYKILKTMLRATRIDGTVNPTGGFFVSALIRHNVPFEQVLNYCDLLIKENLNPQALSIAMENSLRFKNEELALKLFEAAKKREFPIRTHYFWPLIIARAKQNDIQGVYRLLNIMNKDFNTPINTETLRDYVIPNILKKNTDIGSLLFDLKSCGISVAASVSSIVNILLQSGQIEKAAQIASSYRSYFAVSLFRKPLVQAFVKSRDVDSFTTLLKQIAAGIQWKVSTNEAADREEDDEVPEYRESIGQIVSDVVQHLKNKDDCAVVIEEILKLMLEKGVGLSSRAAENIQNTLQNKLTQEISASLEKLTSEELATHEQPAPSTRISARASEESLERIYETQKANGELNKTILKQLFAVYGRTHKLDKLLQIKEELDKENFVFTTGMKAYLIDTYVENGKVDEAWNTYKSYCNEEPDFILHSHKVLRLVLLLTKNERYDEALELLNLKANHGDVSQTTENMNFSNSSLSWRILNHFAEKGDVEKTKQFFDLLISNEYTTPNNILLGPLIKVHIVKSDIPGALKEFENCCLKYRFTPWKNELARKCIEVEDANALQRITDLSTQIHGEVNSLYDLMLSFLECGRIRQAKKILETPGLRLRHDRLQNACQKYQNLGAIEHLENLLEVTKNINAIDKSDLYYNLLLTYDKADAPQKALSLWMQLQENDEQPSDMFLVLLADILQKNNMPVPFTVPTLEAIPSRVQRNESRIELSPVSKNLRKILKSGNIDEAVRFKNSKKPEQLNNTDLSLLLEGFLSQGRIKESKEVLAEILRRGVLPMTRILKYFFIKCMLQGDVESFEMLKDKLSPEMKARTLYNLRLCGAYAKAGRIEEFIDKMEKKLDSLGSSKELEFYEMDFPRGSMLSALLNHPEILPAVQRIADKCLERDSKRTTPINILWMYHLIQKNYEEADKIWRNYLQNTDKVVLFKSAANHAMKTNDVELLDKLINVMEKKNAVKPGALGILHGYKIKMMINQGKIQEAKNYLDEVVEKVPIDYIIKDSLQALKVACASRNIPFNYSISTIQKSRQEEESGSDSD